MTETQKDLMLAILIEQVQSQIVKLVEQDLIEESMALYREWEEHLNDDIKQVYVLTVS